MLFGGWAAVGPWWRKPVKQGGDVHPGTVYLYGLSRLFAKAGRPYRTGCVQSFRQLFDKFTNLRAGVGGAVLRQQAGHTGSRRTGFTHAGPGAQKGRGQPCYQIARAANAFHAGY